MKRTLIIILGFFSTLLVRAQEPLSKTFLNGEWVSDSLITANEQEWRNFVFFDSLGLFYRTSWWTKDYLIDKELKIVENIIQKADLEYLSINVVDSNTIELRGNNYYGKFYRNRGALKNEYNNSLQRFIIGDSVKKKAIGNWTLDTVYVVHTDTSFMFPNEFLAERKKVNFLGEIPDENLQIEFTLKNLLLVKYLDDSTKYFYHVDNHKFSISKSDYIINIEYHLLKDTLTIKEHRVGVERTLVFKKQ